MKVELEVVYPAVNRAWPNPSDPERRFLVVLDVGNSTWKTSSARRHHFCSLLFAGCGNHPGLFDGIEPVQPFDSGDRVINNVHNQWATQRTRSMSVGDLVVIKELNETWLCDNVGWVLLIPEQAESWLKHPRKYGCCSFELSEWMEAATGITL